MSEVFSFVIERDTYNSILYTILGGLFLLATFHMVMYFQNRDRSYLLYSLYAFFSFLAYITVLDSGFLRDISDFHAFDFRSKQLFTIIYNGLYFLFFAQFLDIKRTNLTWYRIIIYPPIVFMAIATLCFFVLKSGYDWFFEQFNLLFTFLITLHTLVSFYILLKIKNNLKYYILVGGITLFFCSIAGEKPIRELPFLNLTQKTGDFIYFVGLFLENIAFSFALGHKQRNIYLENVSFNKNLIAELQKNEILKNQMTQENEKRLLMVNEQSKYEQEISELRLAIFQTQMSPHFIFNALNSIKYYILEHEPGVAAHYLTKFSNMIRTILAASTLKDFTLEEELKTIQVYVDIENLRFENELNFNIEVAEDIDLHKVKLPPMVLQPLLENAIIHGVASVDHKKIDLKVKKEDKKIVIKIVDNGVGRDKAEATQSRTRKLGKSLGSKITDGMLKNYFGADSYTMTYYDLEENGEAKGTMVVLEIPAS